MSDIVSPDIRARMMAGIRSKDTRPELLLRKGLHREGLRYRLHITGLPGTPDLVFPGPRAVLFVNGCFWHGHGCHLFKWPNTRTQFWRDKIEKNRTRDSLVQLKLEESGWRVGIVWECALKGRTRISISEAVQICAEWIRGKDFHFELRGGNDSQGTFIRPVHRRGSQEAHACGGGS